MQGTTIQNNTNKVVLNCSTVVYSHSRMSHVNISVSVKDQKIKDLKIKDLKIKMTLGYTKRRSSTAS